MALASDEPDGRRRRSAHTAQAMIEALLSLVREKHERPTAMEVAERAGCSARSVFERFGNLEALAVATFDYVLQKWAEQSATLPLHDNRETRIEWHVRTRAHICETWLPIWRNVLSIKPRTEAMQARIERVRQLTRERLNLIYRPELDTLSGEQRHRLLIGLEGLIDFECWGQMREYHQLSIEEACLVWREMIDRLLPSTSA